MIHNIFSRLGGNWADYFKGSAVLGIAGLAVLLIRNTQNRDMKALQIKLDELIAEKNTVDSQFEDLTDDEFNQLQNFYKNVEIQRMRNRDKNDVAPEQEMTYYRYK
ncbi:low affinity iron permease family protein [Chryseobacterium pennipullorum]|uniref:Low affinity iron permease family protein n=1 Tax=Chryseobacterium pennipullorum TaxID=2258963 RepID=A0A3D9B0Q4_9FLAO|nr:low affinity iron permease family protein [Chryseobacterium pennipullorum]REC47204.1 hypothetical protein DRF67_11310 [Chryseobacterium pennipullorum]